MGLNKIARACAGAFLSICAASCSGEGAETAPALSEDAFTFIVIGDVPYSDRDEAMLLDAQAVIRESAPPFVIHVGDYKGGGEECLPVYDLRHGRMMADLAPTPVFYTPGDNEWTDCDRFEHADTGEVYSELDRLEEVRKLFFSEAVDAPEGFAYEQQSQMAENARWTYDDVHFLTLHVTGTNNGRDHVMGDPLARASAAVNARDSANLVWLAKGFADAQAANAKALVIAMQGDVTKVKKKRMGVSCEGGVFAEESKCDGFMALRAAIRDGATDFNRPVLVIHGDTSPFTLNQDFAGDEASNLWRLNVLGDGESDVAVVSIDAGAKTPFHARGLLTGAAPDAE